MCDHSDIGYFYEPNSKNNANLPAVFIYDQYPGGIGLSAKIFNIFDQILFTANQVISQCDCQDGCPSCVGPAGENGLGGKPFTQAILNELLTV